MTIVADLSLTTDFGGAAGHLAVRGKNLSRMVGTYGGGGGSLREQFHVNRQESVIALTGLYGNNPATDLRNKFNAFGEMYSSQLTGVNYAYVGGQGYWHDFDLGMDYVRNRRQLSILMTVLVKYVWRYSEYFFET